ncbi:enoyl-CoA hydratase/isomerase family protein, partial [Streptacidiphilus anmyonensis]|uniref:enoyl-CoA hydratase/isomerase family protein n=1 Tax=Streptacidiphilus anmyonensis TaxID=405782 RepID=UPI001364A143
MSGDAVLLVEDTGNGVRRLTLNRPEALNAVTADLRERLIAALEEASAARSVRVVVLTGAGRAFCSGADLSGGTRGGGRRDEGGGGMAGASPTHGARGADLSDGTRGAAEE